MKDETVPGCARSIMSDMISALSLLALSLLVMSCMAKKDETLPGCWQQWGY